MSARTGVGQGPEAEIVFVGMEMTETTPTVIIAPPTETPTAVISLPISQGTMIVTETTSTSVKAIPTSIAPPTETLILGTGGSRNEIGGRDAEYYVVRIVPPIVVFLALVILIGGVVLVIIHSRVATTERKGIYECKFTAVGS